MVTLKDRANCSLVWRSRTWRWRTWFWLTGRTGTLTGRPRRSVRTRRFAHVFLLSWLEVGFVPTAAF